MQPEVAIVGGGPAGLSLAAILEQYGISYTIFEKHGKDEKPAGGCLDMHAGSGRAAFEAANCLSELEKYGRRGEANIHQVWTHDGQKSFAFGEGEDIPEMDRHEIKKAFLTVVPDAKIRWGTGVIRADRDDEGRINLHLSDGTVANGFSLVVGADGTWSKVRPLVSLLTQFTPLPRDANLEHRF